MDLGPLSATLGCDASGLRSAEQQMQSFGASAESVFGKAGSAATSCAGQIASIVGVTLSVAGAFALAHTALSTWYSLISSGINKVESFKKEMISTSYLLAAQSIVEKPDLGKAYAAWGDYYKWMHEQAMEADKAAASGMEDIMAVATQLLKKGVKATNFEEFNVIARLTDVMKGAIPGYASLAMQARGEIEAILSGTNRMGAQTAIILSGIDSEFKKNMASARAAGKEFEYFNNLLPKIEQYTRDMMGTLDAVTSSLKAAYSVVQIKAFGDAHKDIVRFIGDLGNKIVENGKLTADGEKFALALGQAWAQAKVSITDAVEYMLKNFPQIVTDVGNIVSGIGKIGSAAASAIPQIVSLISKLSELASNPLTWAVLGAGAGMVAGGPLGAAIGGVSGLIGATAVKTQSVIKQTTPAGISPAEAQKSALVTGSQELMARYGISTKALEGASSTTAPPTPGLRPPTGKEGKGGGGGGADAEINRLNSLFDTLTKELANLTGGKAAEIYANLEKTVNQVYKKTEDRAKSAAEVEVLAREVAAGKMNKLYEDTTLWIAKEYGNQTVALNVEEEEKLRTVRYTGEMTYQDQVKLYNLQNQIHEVFNKKRIANNLEIANTELNSQKAYLDALASASPYLEDQLVLKKASLEIENQLAQDAITKLMLQKEELRGYEAIFRQRQEAINQAKQEALIREGWMVKGWEGGLRTGALDRSKEATTREAQWTIDAMKGAESWLGETGGQAFVDTIHNAKTDFMKMFSDIGDSMIKQLFKMGTTKLFDTVWGAFLDKGPGKLGTESNPMVVTIKGMGLPGLGKGPEASFGRSVTAAGKTGMTLGGGQGAERGFSWTDQYHQMQVFDKAYDKNLKDWNKEWKTIDKTGDASWKGFGMGLKTYSKDMDGIIDQNQEAFKSEYLTDYQNSFTGMATNITGIWGTAQGLMTAAGASGEAQRYATMVSYGMQGVQLLYNIVAKGTLAKAWSAGASAYASTWEYLGFPLAVVVAPLMAAIAFAGTLAAGSGGGGGGGSTSNISDSIGSFGSSAGGDYQVSATGPRIVHQEETILPAWAAQSWRDIVSQESTGRRRPGENRPSTVHVQMDNHFNAELTQAQCNKSAKNLVKAIERETGNRLNG